MVLALRSAADMNRTLISFFIHSSKPSSICGINTNLKMDNRRCRYRRLLTMRLPPFNAFSNNSSSNSNSNSRKYRGLDPLVLCGLCSRLAVLGSKGSRWHFPRIMANNNSSSTLNKHSNSLNNNKEVNHNSCFGPMSIQRRGCSSSKQATLEEFDKLSPGRSTSRWVSLRLSHSSSSSSSRVAQAMQDHRLQMVRHREIPR